MTTVPLEIVFEQAEYFHDSAADCIRNKGAVRAARQNLDCCFGVIRVIDSYLRNGGALQGVDKERLDRLKEGYDKFDAEIEKAETQLSK